MKIIFYEIFCFIFLIRYFVNLVSKFKIMDMQHKYTVEEVLEIYNSLEIKDKELVKNKLLIDEADFERLVKEDFIKYDATFKSLA